MDPESDVCLPEQFFTIAQVNTPEQRLMLALLESAWGDIDLFVKCPTSRHAMNLAIPAWEWVDKGQVGLFPFDLACESLNLDPEKIRNGIKKVLPRLPGGVRCIDGRQ